MFHEASLEDALHLLGDLLNDRGHSFEAVVVGGGGLLLLGISNRPTKDLDLVALRDGDALVPIEDSLPSPLVEAIADVARVQNLSPNWINAGPQSLLRLGLPEGFVSRLERRVYGALTLSLASRIDQIYFKLYATADDRPEGKHHVDLRRLEPTHSELLGAASWARTHDNSGGFELMLRGVLRSFGVEDF